jgi:hypothetical protein
MFELITEVGGFDGLLDSTDDLGTGNLLMTDDSGRAACTCVLFIEVKQHSSLTNWAEA